MRLGLEQLYQFLQSHGQENQFTHVIFEARGRSEDIALELNLDGFAVETILIRFYCFLRSSLPTKKRILKDCNLLIWLLALLAYQS